MIANALPTARFAKWLNGGFYLRDGKLCGDRAFTVWSETNQKFLTAEQFFNHRDGARSAPKPERPIIGAVVKPSCFCGFIINSILNIAIASIPRCEMTLGRDDYAGRVFTAPCDETSGCTGIATRQISIGFYGQVNISRIFKFRFLNSDIPCSGFIGTGFWGNGLGCTSRLQIIASQAIQIVLDSRAFFGRGVSCCDRRQDSKQNSHLKSPVSCILPISNSSLTTVNQPVRQSMYNWVRSRLSKIVFAIRNEAHSHPVGAE